MNSSNQDNVVELKTLPDNTFKSEEKDDLSKTLPDNFTFKSDEEKDDFIKQFDLRIHKEISIILNNIHYQINWTKKRDIERPQSIDTCISSLYILNIYLHKVIYQNIQLQLYENILYILCTQIQNIFYSINPSRYYNKAYITNLSYAI